MENNPPEKSSNQSLETFMDQVRSRMPTDLVMWHFMGDKLILRAGRDASSWSDFELVFQDVVYLELPVYMDSATIHLGGKEAFDRVRKCCNSIDPKDVVIEIIEDEDWAEGAKRHCIVSKSVEYKEVESE